MIITLFSAFQNKEVSHYLGSGSCLLEILFCVESIFTISENNIMYSLSKVVHAPQTTSNVIKVLSLKRLELLVGCSYKIVA